MPNSMGSFEAKTHFGQLIERAMHGEEIFITRRGKTVAKIMPVNTQHDVENAKAAALPLRSLVKEMHLGKFYWDDWKSYRDQGMA